MSRPSALALAAALAVASCDGGERQTCPGVPIASLHLTGARVHVGDPVLAGVDPVAAIPDCGPALGYPDALVPFDATLAADPVTHAAALCSSRGVVLFGQRGGARYVVETGTTGAVLGAQCAATCTAAMRLVVAGDLATGGEGEPVSFGGVLVEVMSPLAESECGACTGTTPPALPCAARYAVTGTP